jgi:transposase
LDIDAALLHFFSGQSSGQCVASAMGRKWCIGTGYVFCNRAGNRLRVLVVDATGVSLCHRRLHQGSFVQPKPGDALVKYLMLIEGAALL